MRNICKQKQTILTLVLMERTEKENYVCHKVLQVMSKMIDALKTKPTLEANDENQLYYEVVDGHNKKGRVYEIDQSTSMYYDRPRHSCAGEAVYIPSVIVAKFSQENKVMKEKVVGLEAWDE